MGEPIQLDQNETFINLCLAGMAEADQVDDYVEQWHKTDASEARQLHEYLGFSLEEYSVWIHKAEYLAEVLQSRKAILNQRWRFLFKKGLSQIMDEYSFDLDEAAKNEILLECNEASADILVMTPERAINLVLLVVSGKGLLQTK